MSHVAPKERLLSENVWVCKGRLPPLARKIWMTASSLNRPVAVVLSTFLLGCPSRRGGYYPELYR
jgi:hypothetical protein